MYPRFWDATDTQVEQLASCHIPNLDDSAVEVLRAQEGVGTSIDLPPQTIIFTDSLSAKAVAEKRGYRIECDTFVTPHASSGVTSLRGISNLLTMPHMNLKGCDLRADIMTKPFRSCTSARGQQLEMDSLIKHRREAQVLGHSHTFDHTGSTLPQWFGNVQAGSSRPIGEQKLVQIHWHMTWQDLWFK